MDELISLALKALEEKKAQAGQAQQAEAPAERYRRILDDLRARSAAPPFGAPSVVSPQQPAPTPPPRPAPPPPPPPEPVLSKVEGAGPKHGPLHGLFEGGNSLLRAVVAAELLDRPLALRESAHWQKR
ncbi:MAG: hypothetical protein JO024_01575 [Candidatus Eremiobacteraeota bacterium]|nr:hypothetical protein [Candidatus Eremiobacteraeota bacterium]